MPSRLPRSLIARRSAAEVSMQNAKLAGVAIIGVSVPGQG